MTTNADKLRTSALERLANKYSKFLSIKETPKAVWRAEVRKVDIRSGSVDPYEKWIFQYQQKLEKQVKDVLLKQHFDSLADNLFHDWNSKYWGD